ncbi:MAG: DUF547 domain-containing protein [Hyphomicrobiaceae bacterium]
MSAWQPQAAVAGVLEDVFQRHTKGSTATVDHAAFDSLLKTYVAPGADSLNRVHYGQFKTEAHGQLKQYVAALEAVDVAKLDRREQFAFWANLYNAKTVDIVLDKYPVASIKDISLGGGLFAAIKGGPWKAKVTTVSGQSLSLDDIEHVILRGLFKDPRVHYAVNCASVGCPNLQAEAYTGARLEEQLVAAAQAFVNSPRGVRDDGTRLTLSSIYSWFQADFGGNEAGVVKHLTRYAAPELKKRLESNTGGLAYDYDWRLNEVEATPFAGVGARRP